MRRVLLMAAILVPLVLASSPPTAHALPRFAARAGSECTLCHISPSGGGPRNRYGRHVFQQTRLAIEWPGEADKPGAEMETESTVGASKFSGDLTEWLSIGADLRLSYIYSEAERGVVAGSEPELQSTFFLMQADLYTSAKLGSHVAVVLDVGIYTGFEAWFLVRAMSSPSDFDLFLKVGHFLPSFGIRDVNHDLFTRAGIGLGATDRDTGVELTGFAGPFSLSVSLVNGTIEDSIFDTHGEYRSFEKAIVSRAGFRFELADWLKGQVGGSFYYNDNTDAPNPLFETALSPDELNLAKVGVDELRAGAFVMMSLGRFTYLGELVYVRDRFIPDEDEAAAGAAPAPEGYVSYQELDIYLARGAVLAAMVEFEDPNISIANTSSLRLGLGLHLFLDAFVELSLLARRTLSDFSRSGNETDVVVLAHAFF